MSNKLRKKAPNHESGYPDAVIAVGTVRIPFFKRFKLLLFGKIEIRSETPVSKPVKVYPGRLDAYVRGPEWFENWRENRVRKLMAGAAMNAAEEAGSAEVIDIEAGNGERFRGKVTVGGEDAAEDQRPN